MSELKFVSLSADMQRFSFNVNDEFQFSSSMLLEPVALKSGKTPIYIWLFSDTCYLFKLNHFQTKLKPFWKLRNSRYAPFSVPKSKYLLQFLALSIKISRKDTADVSFWK